MERKIKTKISFTLFEDLDKQKEEIEQMFDLRGNEEQFDESFNEYVNNYSEMIENQLKNFYEYRGWGYIENLNVEVIED